jgi:hypothetical protein
VATGDGKATTQGFTAAVPAKKAIGANRVNILSRRNG